MSFQSCFLPLDPLSFIALSLGHDVFLFHQQVGELARRINSCRQLTKIKSSELPRK